MTSMIVKSNYYREDDFGQEANIGDIIVYTERNYLNIAYILGFTEKGMYISFSEDHYQELNKQTERRYLLMRFHKFKVLEKNNVIPDILKPFCYFHQMKQ